MEKEGSRAERLKKTTKKKSVKKNEINLSLKTRREMCCSYKPGGKKNQSRGLERKTSINIEPRTFYSKDSHINNSRGMGFYMTTEYVQI